MKLVVFVVLCVLVAWSEGGRCSSMNRDTLLGCFMLHVDANHDGNITLSEIPSFTKPWFFEMCDVNHDGVLNLSDWNAENACCRDTECIYKVKILFDRRATDNFETRGEECLT